MAHGCATKVVVFRKLGAVMHRGEPCPFECPCEGAYSRAMAKKQKHLRDGIYQRPDRPGYWMSYVDEHGKRIQKKCKSATMTEAKAEVAAARKLAAQLAKRIADGDELPTDDTFAAVAERYLAYQKKRHKAGQLSAPELVRQTGIIEAHLAPFFAGMKIAKIRRSKLNAYIESRTGEASAGSIIKETNVLKHLFALACDEWEIIDANPAKRLKLPEAPPGRTRHLDPVELARLFAVCPAWLSPIIGLAVATGCAAASCCGFDGKTWTYRPAGSCSR
jgi:hypothetical protein